ncbi:SufD family Fe-S cluster assembly protein [Traorella massiliensis]|uniref:SufD family Fe-S cluster assembly protein n=1 Tax=Traorella massiliensis TaxID=1903263 RepID=UPI0023536BAF|nr:SufD family Fe-S cluster assembly protein [Traorella massiliensis]
MEKVTLTNHSFEKMDIQESKELEIYVEKNAEASLYIATSAKVDLKCSITLEENAHLKALFWNECEGLNSECVIMAKKDAKMELNLGEVNSGEVQSTQKIYLQGEGSELQLRSALAVSEKKHFEIECVHEAPYTQSNMENYAVVYEKGNFKMNDTGRILKDAYGSNSHQSSRALVLSEDQTCEITPILLIDENDVQASHATTIGQIDENQLYYLQTRGLTKKQALGLITVGYLMPIASVLDDETLKEELTSKIEKKVGLS